jgi:D-lyxose ketol-isomerase
MRRSEINNLISRALIFFKEMNFHLPPFATFSLDDWSHSKTRAKEIFDLKLGWDITDFGLGNFEEKGLFLFTLRNGVLNSNIYSKSYAEKIMIVQENQLTPLHYHRNKREDIINRGGGDLVFQFYQSVSPQKLSRGEIELMVDGFKRVFSAGEKVVLKPGESVTLPPYMFHSFVGKNNNVLVGEVSNVNDDETDNYFYQKVGRFPEIIEDEAPLYLLAMDYQKFLH